MNTFWVRKKYRIVGAAGLVALYLFIAGTLWVLTGAKGGERFGFLMFFLNLPVYLLMVLTPLGWWLEPMGIFGMLIILLGGLLPYGLMGWFLGPVLERFDLEGQKQSARNAQKSDNEMNVNKGKDIRSESLYNIKSFF